ncbi:hypothetical protein PWO95_02335 [Weissella paramesenteroides]|jgi:phosphoribosylaminoimidazole-succinocarboxamide synthase|uniref:hypothetical protein n=1 Tax=Weissella paramesenteroides TaxID=1249 RepID=UPI0005AAD77B|nr:hypothetical protein [Weissella paramesenteroides]TPF00960.1 hypothetical protein DIS13_08345 [Weissella paramesenteroides]WEA53413.1 hypothetical protein PWO95_02335 [Weissella paramesenteroides]
MSNSILTDYPALVEAVLSIADKLETSDNGRQWLNKQQAQEYVNLGKQAFKKLVDDGVIKVHSLDNHGLARLERYNRDELDEAMKSL